MSLGTARIGADDIRVPFESHPDPDSDAWLADLRAGVGDAWRQLFDELSPAVAGYVRLQGVSDVDDAVSEVFLGVFRNIGSFRGSREALRSWIFTITHHRIVDDRRRRSRDRSELAASAAVFDEAPPVCSVGTEERALAGMATARVVELCQQLAPLQRDVLLLRLVADLTIAQVAEALGRSVDAVKALQRRGLAHLHEILTTEGVPL